MEKPAEQGLPAGRVLNGVGTSQYGTSIQPTTYVYDDADRMSTLTTYRVNDSSVSNPLQWSSEITDTELSLVYYNYRHYNTAMDAGSTSVRLQKKVD